jgi:predicted nucleotidyltransferase
MGFNNSATFLPGLLQEILMGDLEYLTQKEKDAIYHLKHVLANWLDDDVVKVIIFGSRIKIRDPDEKDIDVLIVVRNIDKNKLRKVNEIVMDVNLEDNVMLAPLVYDEAEFNDPINRETAHLMKILQEGIEV